VSGVTPAASPTRVLLVDDNASVRALLRDMLDDGHAITVIGEAADGPTALELAAAQRPEVTLLDHRMPLRDGLAVIAALSHHTRVLLLTRSDEDDIVLAAIRAGACGYLIHGRFSPAELHSAVHAAADGQTQPSPPARTTRTRRIGGAPPDRFGLTRREREIMELIAQGWTNRAIAQHLFLSPKTVQNHINRLFAKLDAANRAAAIRAWRD
jgi:DNA-binding NarL/FixJ family response regulator